MKKTLLSRPVAALMLVLHLGGCTSWRPVAVSPRQFIEETSLSASAYFGLTACG